LVRQLKNQSAVKVIRQLEEILSGHPEDRTRSRPSGRANLWAVARWKRPVGRRNAGSHAPGSSGVRLGTKACCARKRSGATVAGPCSSRTPPSTLQETDMCGSRAISSGMGVLRSGAGGVRNDWTPAAPHATPGLCACRLSAANRPCYKE
jgi:hypothetical protein